MKTLKILILIFTPFYGMGQTPTTVAEHYRLWKFDSTKIENHFKVNEKAAGDNAAAITAEQNKWVVILPTSNITINANNEVDVKLAQIVAAVLAQIPPQTPVDLTSINNRLNSLELFRDSARIAFIKKDNEIATAVANDQTLNSRLIQLQSDFDTYKQVTADTLAAFKKAITDTVSSVKKRADQTNTLVYSELKRFTKIIDSLRARITVSEGKVALNKKEQSDLASDYTPVNLWADKPKQNK